MLAYLPFFTFYFLPEDGRSRMTRIRTARARIVPTVGLWISAGIVLDASTGVVEGVVAIAVCLLLTGALLTCAIV